MSGILNASCCCPAVTCLPRRPFRITLRARAANELWDKTDVTTALCPGAAPSCDVPTIDCNCPNYASCLSTFTPQSGNCNTPGIDKHYISTFEMDTLVVTLPYVDTITTSQPSQPGCGWFADISGTLTQSGLSYIGEREVDRNQADVDYRRDFTGCASCVTWTTSGETDETQTVTAAYAYRCVYGTPPAYMSVSRPNIGTYVNWTWEITGGQFIIKNASGVTQSTYNLATRTLAQAVTDINADPAVIATGPVTAVPADSFPATLMYDRPAALLQTTPAVDRVWLEVQYTTVQRYQDGLMGPRWIIGNTPLGDPCLQEFPLKAGCDTTSDPYDYTGGTDAAAELVFCNGIGTRFLDWTTEYDPTSGLNDECLGWVVGWGGTLENYPLGYFDCDSETGDMTWVETLPCEDFAGGTVWTLGLGAYGNLATTTTGSGEDMCSDFSTLSPTYCYTTANLNGCDFCDCGPNAGRDCIKETYRRGWRVYKSFIIERL